MSRSSSRLSPRSSRSKRVQQFGPLQYAIIGLTVATALIHFVIAFDYTFILNGLGYLVLLGALYLPVDILARYRIYTRWALIIYTAVTVALWVVITGAGFSMIGYLTKAIEIALIVALWFEGQRERGARSGNE